MKIFIDPGHGGSDPGAIGLNGLRECDVTLDIAKGLAMLFSAAGHLVCLSRNNDKAVSLEQRAYLSNAFGADAYVSIHCNAASNREAHGIEVWTTKGQTRADQIADCVLVEMARSFPHANMRRDLTDGDGDKEANFAVLRLAHAPAILVETEFISHPDMEAMMRTDTWRRSVELAIYRGVTAWTKAIHA